MKLELLEDEQTHDMTIMHVKSSYLYVDSVS
jgi:hypothetical protein